MAGEGEGTGGGATQQTIQQQTTQQQATQQQATQQQATEEGGSEGLAKLSKDELIQSIKDLRSEAAGRRHQLRATEAELSTVKTKLSTIETKQLEEQGEYKKLAEKLQADLATEREQNVRRTIKAELKAAAVEAGIMDLDLVGLIPTANIKFDDAGNLVGVSETITDFKTKKPSFFKPASGATQQTTQQTTQEATTTGKKPPEQTSEPGPGDARKMTKEEYKKAKDAEMRKIRSLGNA